MFREEEKKRGKENGWEIKHEEEKEGKEGKDGGGKK